jgi:type II secretion system protein H
MDTSAIMRRLRARCAGARRGYTLVEMLVVVVMMGLAAAIVVPSLSSAGTMRVQGAVRMIIADITVAQSDAIAFQARRGVVFNYEGDASRYVIAEIAGGAVDTATGIITDRSFGGETFGFSTVTDATLTDDTIYLDELGSPVSGPDVDTPAGSQYIEITGSEQVFRIEIEAYTGRITVRKM